MSIMLQRKRMSLSDVKIKFWIFSKRVGDAYSKIFPANDLGDYNGPLAGNRIQKVAKRFERKNMWQALLISALFTPVGWTIISQDSHNFLGWLAFLGGLSAIIFLFRKGIEHTEQTEKIQKEHEKRITDLEKQIAELQRMSKK